MSFTQTFALRAVVPLAVVATLAGSLAGAAFQADAAKAPKDKDKRPFTDEFRLQDCTFTAKGENPYFILLPGTQHVYEGLDDGEPVKLTISVLNDMKQVTLPGVGPIQTRVVEEREEKGGELIEVSRNFFAICQPTNSVFYFGEEVDIIENGQVVGHEGAWEAGVNGAKPGLVMPGTALVGARYYQETAPGVAQDRAEIVNLKGTLTVPFGTFQNVLETVETTPLEPKSRDSKFYAPGVGLLQDGPAKLKSFTKGQ